LSYTVTWLESADADLERLFDFVLERELSKEDGEMDAPAEAIAAIRASVAMLKSFPFTCRKAEESSFLRELMIPFGRTGYVALFEIVSNTEVVVSAIRHQREDDYH